MMIHLLKSSACLVIFLLFYQIFLERESIHVFKRYYLLVILLLALGIPLITFTEYVAAPVQLYRAIPQADQFVDIPSQKIVVNYWPTILWGIYGMGVVVFGFKFLKNLWNIIHNIRTNPKVKVNAVIKVLLRSNIIPHTFFRYIFLNKQQFETKQIPKEVIVHEETHAKQWHSIDVLFIELLQVLLWFNPLVYWAKYHIKLNHEFLADQAVLKSNIDRASYQSTLLSFTETHHQSLANAIKYSSNSSIGLTLFGKSFTLGSNPAGQVKKRFTVMKTYTSKKSVLLRSVLLLPILVILVYGFSEKKQEEFYANEKERVIQDGSGPSDENTSEQKAQNLTTRENWKPTEKDFKKWKENEGNFAIYIHGKPVKSSELTKYEASDFYHFSINFVPWKDRGEEFPQPYKLHLYTQKEFEKIPQPKFGEIHISVNKNRQLLVNDELCTLEKLAERLEQLQIDFNRNGKRGRFVSLSVDNDASRKTVDEVREIMQTQGLTGDIPENDAPIMDTTYTYNRLAKRIKAIPENRAANIVYLKEIYAQMSDFKKSVVDQPEEVIKNIPTQQGATKDQLDTFNTLAKKYNAQPREKRVIPAEDLKRLETIYRKMSERQKTDAQRFPECPDPKSNHQEGATKKQMAEYNALAKKYNAMLADDGYIRIKKSDVDRLEHLYDSMTEEQRANAEPFPDFPEPPEPPTPPTPPTPPDKGEKEIAEVIIQEIIANQDPYDDLNIRLSIPNSHKVKETIISVPNNQEIERIIEKETQREIEKEEQIEVAVEVKETIVVPSAPPTPPEPKSPLDHIKEMAKIDALFYYEGEEISSDKAIGLLRKNNQINIETKASKNSRPEVRLSGSRIKR